MHIDLLVTYKREYSLEIVNCLREYFYTPNNTACLKGIYMKYFVFITAIMLMLTACTQQSGSDKTTVSEDLPNIKLVFEPYDFEFAETPDLSDWQRMPDANYDNLLGYPVRIEKYRCDLPGEMYGTYYIHGIHKETSESLFTMLREISCYDVDNDGCYEMGFGNLQDEVVMYYMVKRVGEDLEFAEINMPFVEYILKHLNKDADFTYYTRLNGNFGYTVYSENHKAYTDHFLYAEFYGNGYNITYERSFSYAGDVPFESNSPEWMMEIGYDEIVSRGGQPMKIGKLLLHGPDGQLYIYTEDDISMNLSADTIHARELIVHPNVPYAVLIVPYFTEFAEDMQGTCLYLLDLASGEIIESITPLDIFLEEYQDTEKVLAIIRKTDMLGLALYRNEFNVNVSDDIFSVTLSLRNPQNNIEVAIQTFIWVEA